MHTGQSALASYQGRLTGKILVALQCTLSENVIADETAALKKLLSYKSLIESYE